MTSCSRLLSTLSLPYRSALVVAVDIEPRIIEGVTARARSECVDSSYRESRLMEMGKFPMPTRRPGETARAVSRVSNAWQLLAESHQQERIVILHLAAGLKNHRFMCPLNGPLDVVLGVMYEEEVVLALCAVCLSRTYAG